MDETPKQPDTAEATEGSESDEPVGTESESKKGRASKPSKRAKKTKQDARAEAPPSDAEGTSEGSPAGAAEPRAQETPAEGASEEAQASAAEPGAQETPAEEVTGAERTPAARPRKAADASAAKTPAARAERKPAARPAKKTAPSAARTRPEKMPPPRSEKKAAAARPAKAPAPAKKAEAPAPAPPESKRQVATAPELAKLRAALSDTSERHWEGYLGALEARARTEEADPGTAAGRGSPPVVGQSVHLTGVDYTRQVELARGPRVVLHTDRERQTWALVMERSFGALFQKAQEVETALDFDPLPAWDMVGRVTGFDFQPEKRGKGKKDMPLVRVQALRRPKQFVVLELPRYGLEVPGLKAVQDQLAAIHDKAAIPRANEPKELIETLLQALGTGNLSLFRRLWAASRDEHGVGRSFEQFRKAFIACEGSIHFDRYDPRLSPEQYEKAGQVKMFLRRENVDGTVVTRPLTFIREEGQWRIRAGMI